jgi:hypothetical protein
MRTTSPLHPSTPEMNDAGKSFTKVTQRFGADTVMARGS